MMSIDTVNMPSGYQLHYDSQLGYWWTRHGLTSMRFTTSYACAASAQRHHENAPVTSIPADVPPGMALHYATEEQRALDAAVEPRRLAFLAARRARKMHISGPHVGGLWLCRLPSRSEFKASGQSPEGAYHAWHSYWGARP